MIEGEEIFESAQETGYRLCRSGNSESTGERKGDNEIFSATWDKNNRRRLFICSSSGLLRVYNLDNNHTMKYEILFRRFTTYEHSVTEPEQRVNYHWDKMVTIADRPNEIIFLLGVSPILYYTCLPGSDATELDVKYPNTAAAIATMTRSDFPGYIYGTPVMQIAEHPSRVTTMAVSPAGHVLASGDERGNVRLLLLQLLDSISSFKREELKKKKHLKSRLFTEFKVSYNITNQAHEGSLFSMDWLPISNVRDDVHYYGLVTGSLDRAVRIWTVSCCSRSGLKMIPCQLLDTLSTRVLSLCSFELTDKVMEMSIARTISARRLMNNDRDRDDNIMRAYSSKDIPTYNEAEQAEMDRTRSVYIAAGTDVGTIYVWKLSLTNITAAIMSADASSNSTAVAAPKSTITRAPNEFAIDDGSALLSLLQTSDKPITHVTVTSNGHQTITTSDLISNKSLVLDTSKLNSADNVILAAADIGGMVRLHCVDKYASLDDLHHDMEVVATTTGFESPAKSVRSARSDATNMTTAMKLDRIERENLRTHLVTVQRMKDSLKGNVKLSLEQGVEGGQRSNLAGGESAMAVNKPLVMVGEKVYDSSVMACVFQAVYVAPKAKDDDDLAPVSHIAPPNLLVCTSKGEIKVYASDALPSVIDPSLRADKTPMTPSSKSSSSGSSPQSQLISNKSTPEKPDAASNLFGTDNADDISENSELSEDNEVEKKMRQQAERAHSLPSGKRPAPSPAKKADPPRAVKDFSPPTAKIRAPAAVSEPVSEVSVDGPRPRSSPPAPAAPFLAKKSSNSSLLANAAVDKVIPRSRKKEDSPPLSPAQPYEEGDELSFRNDSAEVASMLARQASLKQQYHEVEPQANPLPVPHSKPSYPVMPPRPDFTPHERMPARYENAFAAPAINHSNAIAGEIARAVRDEDEISISTLLTTQTDRLVAGRAAPVDLSLRNNRYGKLTRIDPEEDIRAAVKAQSAKAKKQVDPNWLARKQYGGPSEEDLRVLELQDPLVDRTVNFSIGASSAKGAKYNSEFGLHYEMNKETLQPRFRLEVNASEVLGRINVLDSLQCGAEGRERHRLDSMLALMTSTIM